MNNGQVKPVKTIQLIAEIDAEVRTIMHFFNITDTWMWSAGIVLTAAVVGIAIYAIIFTMLTAVINRSIPSMSKAFTACRGPSMALFPMLTIYISLRLSIVSSAALSSINNAFYSVLIIVLAWFLICCTSIIVDLILRRYTIEQSDNLRARKIHTQLQVIRRIAVFTIIVVSASLILMSFESFRQLGTGILASAGLAGIVIGLAARPTISNIIAGMQIALTQPIRIDDVIVIENEWGRIEEITLTYVVVKIWDLRRLILPISYFIEKPFQNWTRVSADIIGSVSIHVDYHVPIQEVRDEYSRILKKTSGWDGKVSCLQVINAGEKSVEIRALMSAHDSATVWDLRCEIREKLIDYIGKKYPSALPQLRLTLQTSNEH